MASSTDRLVSLLSDGQWHDHHELAMAAGNRYGARKEELIDRGFRIESRPSPSGRGYAYRLAKGSKPKREDRVKIYLTQADTEALLAWNITTDAYLAVHAAMKTFKRNRSYKGNNGSDALGGSDPFA